MVVQILMGIWSLTIEIILKKVKKMKTFRDNELKPE